MAKHASSFWPHQRISLTFVFHLFQISLYMTTRNIGELPADVLLLVFRELQESTVGSLQPFTLSETDQRQTSSRSWIPQITCVCRHWRETALATPLLWQDVHLGPLTTIRHGSSPEIKRSVELGHPLPIRIQVHSKNNIWRPSRFVNAGTDREWPRELSPGRCLKVIAALSALFTC